MHSPTVTKSDELHVEHSIGNEEVRQRVVRVMRRITEWIISPNAPANCFCLAEGDMNLSTAPRLLLRRYVWFHMRDIWMNQNDSYSRHKSAHPTSLEPCLILLQYMGIDDSNERVEIYGESRLVREQLMVVRSQSPTSGDGASSFDRRAGAYATEARENNDTKHCTYVEYAVRFDVHALLNAER